MASQSAPESMTPAIENRRWLDWAIVAAVVAVALRGWLTPGLLASPRLEMVSEPSIIWMAKERLLQGGPLAEWVPFEFGGFPLVRFLSYLLYDLVAAISIVSGASLEGLYKVAFILAYLASGITFYELARHLTKSRGAAIISGIIFAIFPFHIHVASEAWVHAVFWAVMPLLFLAYERSRDDGPTLRNALTMGALLASAPLINTEHTMLVAPFLGAWFIIREWAWLQRRGREWRKLARYWLIAGLLAVGLSAFFVLPGILEMEDVGIHLKHGGESFQSDELLREYAVSPELVWRAIASRLGQSYTLREPTVIASAFWSATWYPGLVAMLLALLGIVAKRKDPRLRTAAGLLALSALFIVGSWLPWNPAPRIPFLGRLVPFRNTIFCGFFGGLCAAYGASWALERVHKQNWRLAVAVALAAIVLLDYYPAAGGLRTVESYLEPGEAEALSWIREQPGGFRTWEPLYAHRDAYLRSYHLTMDNGLHAWGYYDNGAPRHIWALYSWGDLATALDLSSTRYLLTRPGKEASADDVAMLESLRRDQFTRSAYATEGIEVLESPDWRPMVTAYDRNVLYLGDPEYRALDVLTTTVANDIALVAGPSGYVEEYDPAELAGFQRAIVREPWSRDEASAARFTASLPAGVATHADFLSQTPGWVSEPPDDAPPQGGAPPPLISWSRPSMERIEVEIASDHPTTVMVSEAWYPNWRLRIDDEEERVWRVNYAYLGALVPAGEHALVFEYVKPWYVWLGYSISAASLVALIALLAHSRQRGAKTGPKEQA